MITRVVLQVPVDPKLRLAAEQTALDQGFSSLQEAVRVFLKQLAQKSIAISFRQEPVLLSPQAIKRYNKMLEDIKLGKSTSTKTANIDELMAYLQ